MRDVRAAVSEDGIMRHLVVALFAACSSDEPNATDSGVSGPGNDDASADAVAVDTAPLPIEGYCAGTCETDEDCGTGKVCRAFWEMVTCHVDGRPQHLPGQSYPDVGECLADEHCAVRQVCSYGRSRRECHRSCTSDAECFDRGGSPDLPPELHTKPVCFESLCSDGRLGDDCGSEEEPAHVVRREEPPRGECLGYCSADEQCQDGRLCLAR